jgi:MFS family permease
VTGSEFLKENEMLKEQALTGTVSTELEKEKLPIASLSAAFLVDSAEEQALPLLWPHMISSLGASVGQLGGVLGISRLAMTLMYPIWGFAADRFSRKLLLVFFTGFWGLWTLGIGLVDTVSQLTFLRVLSGLGLGVFGPAAFSLISDLFDNESRGRATGIMRAVGLFGIIIAVGLLPELATREPEGWRTGFFIMGLASFISGLFMLTIKEPARGAGEPELRDVITKESAEQYAFSWSDLLTLFRIPSWRYLLLNEILSKGSLYVFTGWNFTFLSLLELEQSAFYMVVGIVFVGLASGSIFFGWLGDRMERRYRSRGRIIMIQFGLILTVPALTGYLLSRGDNLAWLITIGFLSGLSSTAASEGTLWPVAQAILPPELRGSNRAIISMAVGGFSALMLALSGTVVDQLGVAEALLLFVPLPMLLSAIAWVPMLRTYPEDRDALHVKLTQRREELLS